MIVCTRCGTHNPDGATFCRTCAGFLEWSGQRLAPPGATPEPELPEPAPEPEPPLGRPHRIRTAWETIRGGAQPSATTVAGAQLHGGNEAVGSAAVGSEAVGRTAAGNGAAGGAAAGNGAVGNGVVGNDGSGLEGWPLAGRGVAGSPTTG
ncbi:MAG: zinc ribbon domain-containing protein, partial [Acidimicrobiales bacterium]